MCPMCVLQLSPYGGTPISSQNRENGSSESHFFPPGCLARRFELWGSRSVLLTVAYGHKRLTIVTLLENVWGMHLVRTSR